jgi:hypothetical protein
MRTAPRPTFARFLLTLPTTAPELPLTLLRLESLISCGWHVMAIGDDKQFYMVMTSKFMYVFVCQTSYMTACLAMPGTQCKPRCVASRQLHATDMLVP